MSHTFRTQDALLRGVRTALAAWTVCALDPIGPTPAAAQATSAYAPPLLSTARALRRAVPGDLPTSVRYYDLAHVNAPLSIAVAGAPDSVVTVGFPVFQIRYRTGWIVVDAGMDQQVAGTDVTIDPGRYELVQRALRDARLVLITHEHHDHVAGVLRSPYLEAVAGHTLLTTAQAETLRERPESPEIRLDSAATRRYVLADYPLLLPVAPGVVLIKAPGHTPGSQMVYVQLRSGRELLLVGDIAWHMDGIRTARQKPDSMSRPLHEDRALIQQQLDWLRQVDREGAVSVVPCHDQAWLKTLAARGVVDEGLDFRSP